MFKKNDILTIPNLLSLVRLLLIPVIIWLYCVRQDYVLGLLVLILSGLTDIADGIIARSFNMVSDFGKILDPVADKLTQFAVMLCLIERFPKMAVPAAIFFVKELVTGIMGLVAVKRSGKVLSADWHGKVNTVLLYFTMALHMIWPGIPEGLSTGLIIACVGMMLFSASRYGVRNRKLIKGDA